MLVAGGISTDPLERAPTVDDMRTIARRRLPRMSFDFVDGGAGAETTLRGNVDDFARVSLRPRSLVDVSEPSLSTVVVGQRLPMRLVLAPWALLRGLAAAGAPTAARAAAAAALTYNISTASSWSIAEIAAEGSGPLWFQLYMWRSPEVISAL